MVESPSKPRIYLHRQVADIFVPKLPDYMNLVSGMFQEYFGSSQLNGTFDGYGFCPAISEIVSLAFNDRGIPSQVVIDEHSHAFPHWWVSFTRYGTEYAADLVHHQRGARDIVIIPVAAEPLFDLHRSRVKPPPEDAVGVHRFLYGPYVEELYGLFRN